jgi:hypothetical protein
LKPELSASAVDPAKCDPGVIDRAAPEQHGSEKYDGSKMHQRGRKSADVRNCFKGYRQSWCDNPSAVGLTIAIWRSGTARIFIPDGRRMCRVTLYKELCTISIFEAV